MNTHYDAYRAPQLRPGMILRNGETVIEVRKGYSEVTVITDICTHYFQNEEAVQTNVKTNCLYGGLAMGHSHGGFCTADACY